MLYVTVDAAEMELVPTMGCLNMRYVACGCVAFETFVSHGPLRMAFLYFRKGTRHAVKRRHAFTIHVMYERAILAERVLDCLI